MDSEQGLIILDKSSIKDLIYEIRGQRVMLDFELANLYGYEARVFNIQVKNSKERFDSDFLFSTYPG